MNSEFSIPLFAMMHCIVFQVGKVKQELTCDGFFLIQSFDDGGLLNLLLLFIVHF